MNIYERLHFRRIVCTMPLLYFIIENNIEDTFQPIFNYDFYDQLQQKQKLAVVSL